MNKYIFFSIIAALGLLFINEPVAAQKPPKKAMLEIQVSGNCGMCQRRIQNALDVNGIMTASWDRQTKKAEIIYNPRKISEQQIHDLIAGVGHDTEKVKAQKEVYEKLPGCCLYRDNANTH
jgi:bacterioferritin-associated ferredoxin